APLGTHGGLLLLQLHLVETGAKDALRFSAILDLALFVLAGDDQAGGKVRQPDGGIGGIHALTAGTGRTEGIDADVLSLQLDFDFVGLGQHGYGDRRGVDAALLLGYGNALDTMHAAFVLELAVNFVAADEREDFFESADARFAA